MMTAPIEVERKFHAPELSELSARVTANGGTTIGTKSFTDVYYDTSGCALTRRDIWLRCRDDAWELKLPIEEEARRSGGERTVFREVEGAAEVATALRALLPAAADVPPASDAHIVTST